MMSIGRLSPGGSAIPVSVGPALWSQSDPSSALHDGLAQVLGAGGATFTTSGREALRTAMLETASASGRDEVLIPAYACFSVPAAAVAAGLRVRLVDVDETGRFDASALSDTPLERVAAIVVCNLFGIAEPVAQLCAIASAAGSQLIDDAAQALGSRGADGPAGGRGGVGVLSFGRGKPLSALGGGALWRAGSAGSEPAARPAAGERGRALVRAVAYDVARHPWVFRALSAIPQLGIGETEYDPAFARGGIDGAALCLAAALIGGLERANAERAGRAGALAARLAAETSFVPLLAPRGELGVYPRLAVVAPDRESRDAARSALRAVGVTGFYPSSLDAIEALAPHRVDDAPCPVARDFCDRLLTFPTHAGFRAEHVDVAISRLRRL